MCYRPQFQHKNPPPMTGAAVARVDGLSGLAKSDMGGLPHLPLTMLAGLTGRRWGRGVAICL
jgi:hypothetical protein